MIRNLSLSSPCRAPQRLKPHGFIPTSFMETPMRIRGLPDAFNFMTRLNAKAEALDSASDQAKDERRQDSDRKKNNQGESEQPKDYRVIQKEVEEAIHAFSAPGIQATAQGAGPGLKVLFNDSSGRLIRELSGEDFLKLKAQGNVSGKVAGKIIDQKA